MCDWRAIAVFKIEGREGIASFQEEQNNTLDSS